MKMGDGSARLNIEAISTGSISFDIASGIGGIPKGRIIEVYGPESSGKTTLALHMIAQAQKTGGKAAFIDAEHALDPEYSANLGVNIDENSEKYTGYPPFRSDDTHVPISFNPDDYKFEEPNYKELIELYKKLEFRAFIKKLSDKKNIDVTHNKLLFSNKIENVKTHRIESGDIGELRKLLDKNEPPTTTPSPPSCH